MMIEPSWPNIQLSLPLYGVAVRVERARGGGPIDDRAPRRAGTAEVTDIPATGALVRQSASRHPTVCRDLAVRALRRAQVRRELIERVPVRHPFSVFP